MLRSRAALWGAIILFLVLHNDFWLWNAGQRLLGLPVGLTYHLLYCFAAVALMGALVRRDRGHDRETGSS